MAPKLQSKDLRNSKGSNAGSDATGIVETMGRPKGLSREEQLDPKQKNINQAARQKREFGKTTTGHSRP